MKKYNDRAGVALLIVLMSLLFMSIFIFQLQYTSAIDLRINRGSRNRLQSYYLAQSAARMGLLRVHMYRELENLLSTQSNFANLVPKNLRSMVWSFPLPAFPLQGQKSSAPGTFMSVIKGEGSKIPLNLIDGDIHRMPRSIAKNEDAKKVGEAVRKQIQDLLDLRAENEQPFKEKLEKYSPTAIPDSLVDWLDRDDRLIEGGDENTVYERKTPPYKPRNDRFGSPAEVSMIDLWDDDVYRPLKKEISFVNLKAKINCNTISLERLKAYSKNELSDADLAIIQKRRLEEPFASLTDCENFIKTSPDISGGSGFDFPAEIKNNEYDKESVFVVEGSGVVGDSRSIVRLYLRIDEEAVKPNTGSGTGTGGGSGSGGNPPAQGKFQELRVIRFEEGAAQ